MKKYYAYIIKDSETRVQRAINLQERNPDCVDCGVVRQDRSHPDPKATAYRVGTAVALYLNQNSRFYHKEDIIIFVKLALNYIRKCQRSDGSFDLINCNFQSAADTAFLVQHLISAHTLLIGKAKKTNHEDEIVALLEQVLTEAVKGLYIGGFHTPNHRWAIASVLSRCTAFAKKDELTRNIKQYLLEGIDINEYGEFAERSAAGYNVVNNNAMLYLYENLQDDKYLEYLTRNLEMMLYYYEPDGSIFSDNSTRQDKGVKAYPRDYFYLYLYSAYKTGNKAFEAAAHKIINENKERGSALAPDCLPFLMLHPELLEYELVDYGFPVTYNKFFDSSGLVRISKPRYTCSFIAHNTKVMVFQVGATPIYLKMALSYFEHRNIIFSGMEPTADGYSLRFQADGWYYLPFQEVPQTSDWWAMNNSNREKIIKNTFELTINVIMCEDGVDLSFGTKGIDGVLLTLEWGIPVGCRAENNNISIVGVGGGSVVLKNDVTTIYNEVDTLSIGPAFGDHSYVDGKFGSEERSRYHQTLYFTGRTNFNRTVSLRAISGGRNI